VEKIGRTDNDGVDLGEEIFELGKGLCTASIGELLNGGLDGIGNGDDATAVRECGEFFNVSSGNAAGANKTDFNHREISFFGGWLLQ